MFKKRDRNEVRKIRHERVRKKISGTPERPRLCVYRSNKHIYAQVIDDTEGRTLCQCSSLDPEFKASGKNGSNIEGATLVGELGGQRASALGITTVVFDRGGRIYHGRVKAVAEGARSAGLKF